MEADLEQIAGQTGTAVLDIKDGRIDKITGDLNSEDGKKACRVLYEMLMTSAQCTLGEPLKRIVVSYDACNYLLAPGKQHVFIVKTAAPS